MTCRMSWRLTGAGKAGFAVAALAAISVPFVIGALRAQTLPPPPRYRFEVASIRPSNASDNTNRLGPTPQGGLRGQNVTVVQLIALAFGVRPFHIVNAPDWAGSQRFDVVATPDLAEEPASDTAGARREAFRERVRQRLQALLTDRFGLVLRTENRPMPVYKLVIAKGGQKMAGATTKEALSMESNSMMLRGTAVDMKIVADALAGILGRPVLDETGLSGTFNLSIQFADLRVQATPESTAGGAEDPTTAPTILTAITEQLGLRLESTRAPAPVFVVERIQRPTEN